MEINDEEKISNLFDELLLVFVGYGDDERKDICISDIRDDLIILSKKWNKYMGIEENDTS